MEKIRVYLKMKNASAEGLYSLDEDNVLVYKGAIIENPVSEGFVSHNYNKLRSKLINNGVIVDYVLQEDYLFSSTSAAAAVIGGRSAAGPIEWRDKDRNTIKDLQIQRERLSLLMQYFQDNRDYYPDNEVLDEAKSLSEQYSMESLNLLTIEQYDNPGEYNSVTYLMEYKTKKLSGGSFGSSRNKLFFKSEDEYHNAKFITEQYPNLTVDERFELYRNDLYEFVTSFNRDTYISRDFNILQRGTNYIRSKLINIYYPNTIMNLDSIEIMRKIAKYLGMEYKHYNDSIEINIAITNFIYNRIPEARDVSLYTLTHVVWMFYSNEVLQENKTEDVDEAVIIDEETKDDLFMDEVTVDEIEYLLRNKKNIILQGAPGVGKTFSIKKIIKRKFDIVNPEDQILTVQFHQSYSYEEFIEGLRPRTYDTGFSVEPGIFKQFVENNVLLNPDNDYFLIIDEINRGNLSKIFGELLMLIEADKREVEKVVLPYSNQSFSVPKNLYIIGTMNTADRSLALIDYALRRRFSFVNLSPKFSTPKFNDYLIGKGLSEENIDQVNNTMQHINSKIKDELGDNFEIGHSYFVSKTVDNYETWYKNIIKYDIIPLLEEYFFDDLEIVRKIIIDLDLL